MKKSLIIKLILVIVLVLVVAIGGITVLVFSRNNEKESNNAANQNNEQNVNSVLEENKVDVVENVINNEVVETNTIQENTIVTNTVETKKENKVSTSKKTNNEPKKQEKVAETKIETPVAEPVVEPTPVTPTGAFNQAKAQEVLAIVNNERANAGKGQVTWSSSLEASAKTRAEEISTSFSHTRPNGNGWDAGVYAENIAYGQTSASSVMNAWMNSEGHKANILRDGYTTMGVGLYVYDGTYYWVQVFGY